MAKPITTSGRRVRRSRPTAAQAGYNLVLLLVILTGMSIAISASFPLWSSVSQRDKEAELISRGLQYAEAIRVFQVRYQRLPVRLEELVEVKPRCIRQLWKDPMTEDGEWELVMQGGPGAEVGGNQAQGNQGQQGGQRQNRRGTPGGQASTLPRSQGGAFSDPNGRVVGPIFGVRSKSTDKAMRVFMDKDTYDQWVFTADLVSGHVALPDRPPVVASYRTLGRPFRPGLAPQVPIPGQLGQGQPGQPAQPGQPGQPGQVGIPVPGQPGQPGQGRPGLIPQPEGGAGGGNGLPTNPLGRPGERQPPQPQDPGSQGDS